MKMITLENGLRVVVVEMNHLHSCEIGVYVKVGGIDDPQDKKGLSHFTEHMLFRGTASYPSEKALTMEFEKVGGVANACTDEEVTCYHTKCHPTKVSKVLELLSSLLLDHLLLDFQTEKRIILQEAKESLNDRSKLVDEAEVLKNLLWDSHPLGASVIGTLKSIRRINLDDIRSHVKNFYTPDNAVVVLTGKIDSDEVFRLARDYFSRWTGNKNLATIEEYNFEQTVPNYKFVHDATTQFQVSIGFRGVSRNDERLAPSQFLGYTMCESSSGMFSRLRGEKGLVYSVYAHTEEYPISGSFAVNLVTEPKNLDNALNIALDEIVSLASKSLNIEDFRRFQESYFFEMDYCMDNPSHLNMRYGYGMVLDHLRTIDEDKKKINSLTPHMVCKVARQIFDPKNLNIVVIGPIERNHKTVVESAISIYKQKYNTSAKTFS